MKIGDDIQLAIFSTELGNREGEEEEKIFYFYPQSLDIRDQIKIVGLCDAFVRFICSFGREQHCKFVISSKMCQVFYQAEESFWVVMKLFLKNSNKIGEIKSSIKAIIEKAYNEFKILHGTFGNILKTSGDHKLVLTKQILPFFNQFVSSFTTFPFTSRTLLTEELKYGSDKGSILLCREPLDRLPYLELQSDLASLEALYSPHGLLSSVLTCRERAAIVWSSTDESTADAILDTTTLVDMVIKASHTIDPGHVTGYGHDATAVTDVAKNVTGEGERDPARTLHHFGRFLPLKSTFHSLCLGRDNPSPATTNFPDLVDNPNDKGDDRVMDIYLSINGYSDPFQLVAYQIFSYTIGLVFQLNMAAVRSSGSGAGEGGREIEASFFSELGRRLEERLGKRYLHERYDSQTTPSPSFGPTINSNITPSSATGSSDGKVVQNMNCLVINESQNTFRTSMETNWARSNNERNNDFIKVTDYHLIFSRLNQDIQKFLPGSDLTIKVNGGDKSSFWFLAKSCWPKRSLLLYGNKSANLSSVEFRKEADQYLAQI